MFAAGWWRSVDYCDDWRWKETNWGTSCWSWQLAWNSWGEFCWWGQHSGFGGFQSLKDWNLAYGLLVDCLILMEQFSLKCVFFKVFLCKTNASKPKWSTRIGLYCAVCATLISNALEWDVLIRTTLFYMLATDVLLEWNENINVLMHLLQLSDARLLVNM